MSRDPLGPGGGPPPSLAAELLDEPGETSLLDLVDSLLDQGVSTRAEAVLGLAGVDLIYLRLSALLCAADWVLPASSAGVVAPGSRAVAPDSGQGADSDREPPRLARGADVESAQARVRATRAAEAGESTPSVSLPSSSSASRSTDPEPAPEEVHPLAADELEALRGELQTRAASPARWNADPENAQRAVAKLVLTLVDFLRQLMERQAIRRMEEGTVTDDEVERLGVALMRLEETLQEMAARFGIPPEELNLDLGPLGKLT